jgi:hypothetical protein
VKIPTNNVLAYKENENKIRCELLNNSVSTGDSCFLHLNVHFEPFEDDTVSREQSLLNTRTIECPIRAPNFPQYKYTIIWSQFLQDKKIDLFYGNYTLTSYFFVVDKPIDGSIYSCSLFFNKSILLSSNITIKTEPKRSASQLSLEFNGLHSLWSFTIVIPVAGILAALKRRSNRRSRVRRQANDIQVSDSRTLENINLQDLNFVDCMPIPTASQPPVYEEICETEIKTLASLQKPYLLEQCDSSSQHSIIYQTPVITMSGMASLLDCETTLTPIGSPGTLMRIRDRILQLRDQVDDEEGRSMLYTAASKITKKTPNDYPSFV